MEPNRSQTFSGGSEDSPNIVCPHVPIAKMPQSEIDLKGPGECVHRCPFWLFGLESRRPWFT